MPRTRSQVKAAAKPSPRTLPTPPDIHNPTAAATTTTKRPPRPRSGRYSLPPATTPPDISRILAYATAGPFTYDPHTTRFTLDPTFPARHASTIKRVLSVEFKMRRCNELHPAVAAAYREAERGEGVERVVVFTHGRGSVRVFNGYPEVRDGEDGECDEGAEWEAEGWEDVGGVKVVKVEEMVQVDRMEEE